MNKAKPHRGGAPVGYLAELDTVEAGAIRYLRLWCDGPEAQAQVWNDFAISLGPAYGRSALRSFETLCDLCIRHARRPLMRHHVQCDCLGADEACFANFVAAASRGEREDALMIASVMVRTDVAMLLVGLAEEFGHALYRMSATKQPPFRRVGHEETLH